MLKYFLIFSLLSNLSLINCYNFPFKPSTLSNSILNNHMILNDKKTDINIVNEKICHHKNIMIDNICHDPDNGAKIIKIIASSLPKFDSIAPKILHFNDMMIDFALNNDFLSIEIKKKIVLFSINIAINGDEMGSKFLKFFYELVESCL